MTVNLGSPTWVVLVADGATPENLVPYAGWRIGIPQGVVLPTTYGTLIVSGVTVPGYARTVGGELQWVMQPEIDPNIAALNSIPGPQGWTNQGSKSLYANIGGALLNSGISGPDVRTGLKQLYEAAVANYVSAHP